MPGRGWCCCSLAPGPPQLSSDKPAAMTRGAKRVRYDICAQDDACPAIRTPHPYPHDAASRIIIATCLVIPCLHPHLHSSIPTRHGTQFHLHLRLAFGDTWFLVSVLGFGFGRLGSIFPCHAMLPSTLPGRSSRHPWHPNVRRPFLNINYKKTSVDRALSIFGTSGQCSAQSGEFHTSPLVKRALGAHHLPKIYLCLFIPPCTGPRNDALRNTYIPLALDGST